MDQLLKNLGLIQDPNNLFPIPPPSTTEILLRGAGAIPGQLPRANTWGGRFVNSLAGFGGGISQILAEEAAARRRDPLSRQLAIGQAGLEAARGLKVTEPGSTISLPQPFPSELTGIQPEADVLAPEITFQPTRTTPERTRLPRTSRELITAAEQTGPERAAKIAAAMTVGRFPESLFVEERKPVSVGAGARIVDVNTGEVILPATPTESELRRAAERVPIAVSRAAGTKDFDRVLLEHINQSKIDAEGVENAYKAHRQELQSQKSQELLGLTQQAAERSEKQLGLSERATQRAERSEQRAIEAAQRQETRLGRIPSRERESLTQASTSFSLLKDIEDSYNDVLKENKGGSLSQTLRTSIAGMRSAQTVDALLNYQLLGATPAERKFAARFNAFRIQMRGLTGDPRFSNFDFQQALIAVGNPLQGPEAYKAQLNAIQGTIAQRHDTLLDQLEEDQFNVGNRKRLKSQIGIPLPGPVPIGPRSSTPR